MTPADALGQPHAAEVARIARVQPQGPADQPASADHPADSGELTRLTAALQALPQRPLDEHPSVLDEVHRALVAQLDALSEAVRAPGG